MQTKWCSKGKHDQPVEAFSKSARSKDGLFTWCKSCMATYERERYQNGDKARKEANAKKYRDAVRAFLISYLSENPCVECGNSDPIVLQFDQRESAEKEFNISDMIRNKMSIPRIVAEIEKCDVRCANCHAKRTAQQFGWWKTLA